MRGLSAALLALILTALPAPLIATEVATSTSSTVLLEPPPPAPEPESIFASRWFWVGLVGAVMAGSAAAYAALRRPPHYTLLCEGDPERCR
jgi:hypothetical protein